MSDDLRAQARELGRRAVALIYELDEEAEPMLQRALTVASRVPGFEVELRLELSEELRECGELAHAASVLEPALAHATDPLTDLRVHLALARATDDMETLRETIDRLSDPPPPSLLEIALEAVSEVASHFRENEQHLARRHLLRRASRWAPDDLWLRINWVDAAMDDGALDEAAAALEAAPPPVDPKEMHHLHAVRADVARRRGALVPPAPQVAMPADETESSEPEQVPAFFTRPKAPTWNSLTLDSLPSTDEVLRVSFGGIWTAEAFDDVGKPLRGGPRCEKIFGPVVSYTCACGRYASERFKGVICSRCGVELIDSSVRARRHGHVSLASPVIHPWYLDCAAALLCLQRAQLSDVLELKKWIVVNPLESLRTTGELLSSPDPEVEAGTGPEAIAEALSHSMGELILGRSTPGTLKHNVLTVFVEANLLPSQLVIRALPVPPPGAPVPGGKSSREELEAALAEVIACDVDDATDEQKRALQHAVTAYFRCF